MIVVYLSSAMSAPTFAGFRKNCHRASRVAHELRAAGFAVHCAAENGLVVPAQEMTWGQWLRHDEAILERCDLMYRLLPDPAGRVSAGAERETRFAKRHGIPVVYSLREAREFARAARAARRVA